MTDLNKASPDRRPYYKAAGSWSADLHGALRASRRLAWTVAAGVGAIAILEAAALAALVPLKTTVPYAITVDRQTGHAEILQSLTANALAPDAAITQANLAQYVLARETFDATDLQTAYRNVTLWSAADAKEEYLRLMRRSTPESPLNIDSPTTTVAVTVKSVSMLSPTTALVRFETRRREASGPFQSPRPWVAAIAFHYGKVDLSQADRFINPLGFQVTRYRRDAETPSPPPPAAAQESLPE
jgi:type IV secretion system protein VirB8